MLINRGSKDVFTFALPNSGIPENQATALMGSLSGTCKDFYTLYQGTLTERAITALYQSVIDDNQKKVKRILDSRPELLLLPLPKDFIIESKLTWQRFYVEDALRMSVKRKQLNMIELLLPYYETLGQDNLIEQAFAAWMFYKTKKNNQGEEEIIIPDNYALSVESLMKIAEKTSPLSEKIIASVVLFFG